VTHENRYMMAHKDPDAPRPHYCTYCGLWADRPYYHIDTSRGLTLTGYSCDAQCLFGGPTESERYEARYRTETGLPFDLTTPDTF